jgi:hypothetical protein
MTGFCLSVAAGYCDVTPSAPAQDEIPVAVDVGRLIEQQYLSKHASSYLLNAVARPDGPGELTNNGRGGRAAGRDRVIPLRLPDTAGTVVEYTVWISGSCCGTRDVVSCLDNVEVAAYAVVSVWPHRRARGDERRLTVILLAPTQWKPAPEAPAPPLEARRPLIELVDLLDGVPASAGRQFSRRICEASICILLAAG